MESYPVLWQILGEGDTPVAGRLEIADRSISLHGGQRGAEKRVEVPLAEISCARRALDRVGALRSVAVDTRTLGTILIATLGDLSIRGEILQDLQALVAAVA